MIQREWEGLTAYIIAGGPSVAEQDLTLLEGKKVIAVNSSCYTYPNADYLFFGDSRWWRENRKAVEKFAGKVVTTAASVICGRAIRCQKKLPPGLCNEPTGLVMRRTSLTAAINLAVHLGVKNIVLLGADGKKAKDGSTHHHKPHKWPQRAGCWDEQKKDLVTIVGPLRRLGVQVLNASPGSAWDMWPIVRLEDTLGGLNALNAGDVGEVSVVC